MLAYIHGILTSHLFTNLGRNIADTRIIEMIRINSLGFANFANRYYPKAYSIDLTIY